MPVWSGRAVTSPIAPVSGSNGSTEMPPSQYLVTSKKRPVRSNVAHVLPRPPVDWVHTFVSAPSGWIWYEVTNPTPAGTPVWWESSCVATRKRRLG